MKKTKTIIILALLISIISITSFAKGEKQPNVIFMGTIEEVIRVEGRDNIKIIAKGYIKGCSIYEEELIGIINEETFLIKDKCKESGESAIKEKVTLKSFKAKKGENVFMVLDGAMTKSIPPQATIKAILVNNTDK